MSDEPVVVETPLNEAVPVNLTPVAPTDWRSGLSEDMRALPSFEKFKDQNELAKSYLNLEKTLGKDKLPLPKDDKDEAGWATVYSRLGRPESHDKYDVKLNLSEGLSVQPEILDGLKKQAFQKGLSSKQFQGMLDVWADMENTAYKQRQDSIKDTEIQTETSLRRALGSNYESAKKNVEAYVRSVYPKNAQERVLERVKSDAEEFEAMFNASKNFSEDVLKVGKPMGLNPTEAESEYNKILADTKGAYYDAMHPEHEAIKKRMYDLLQYMSSGKQG